MNRGGGEGGSHGGCTRGAVFPSPAQHPHPFLPQEKVIPSVVIQPASNNEGEGEHEISVGAEPKEVTDDAALPGPSGDTPEPATEQRADGDSQTAATTPANEASQELPAGFLYKVKTFVIF